MTSFHSFRPLKHNFPISKCHWNLLSFTEKPQSVRILGRDGVALGNATRFGPFTEGEKVELECEAAGAKPIPEVAWYNGTTRMRGELFFVI